MTDDGLRRALEDLHGKLYRFVPTDNSGRPCFCLPAIKDRDEVAHTKGCREYRASLNHASAILAEHPPESPAPPASAGTRLCPEKHGAEREMELQWVCETCGHRESAEEMEAAGTERPGLREAEKRLLSTAKAIDGSEDYIVVRMEVNAWEEWQREAGRAALVERREEMSLRRSIHHGTGYTEESAEEFARDFKEWFGLSIAEADVTSKTDRRKPATPPASAGTEVPGLREVAWAFLKDNPDASALSLFVALFPGTITEDDIRWAKAAVARTLV